MEEMEKMPLLTRNQKRRRATVTHHNDAELCFQLRQSAQAVTLGAPKRPETLPVKQPAEKKS